MLPVRHVTEPGCGSSHEINAYYNWVADEWMGLVKRSKHSGTPSDYVSLNSSFESQLLELLTGRIDQRARKTEE